MSEIKPALTAEEWAEGDEEGNTFVDRTAWAYEEAGVTDRFQLMALCNHALPDDDPRKIVRADVQRCMAAADRAEEHSGYNGDWRRSDWRDLAAKLAALLPPED